jgi:hypothetical protein
MKTRPAKAEEWDQIKAMHGLAHYGFELPEHLRGLHVVEEDGIILGAAGYELTAQVVAVLNPEIVEPQKRISAMVALHAPLAGEVLVHEIKSVYAFCDPRFRGFEHRMRKMGWSKKLWPCMFLERAEIVAAFGAKEYTCT